MTAQADSILKLFRDTGAYLEGHFLLTGGRHSAEYLQCALVLQHPAHAERLGVALAAELKKLPGATRIAAVVSPAIGGLIIGHEVARALSARFVFAERDSSGRMTMRRGFLMAPGETAAVVEDVITTGGSTREVVEILKSGGARVVGAGSIIDRSGGTADVGAPRVALATMSVTSYAPEECPQCRVGLPAVKPGSRK